MTDDWQKLVDVIGRQKSIMHLRKVGQLFSADLSWPAVSADFLSIVSSPTE